MKFGKRVLQIGLLFLLCEAGTWLQQLFHIAIPGSLIGMMVLLFLLWAKLLPLQWFETGGETLMTMMPILLMPSMVGLINYGPFLLKRGGGLFVTAVISTLLIIVIAGHTGQYLARRGEREG